MRLEYTFCDLDLRKTIRMWEIEFEELNVDFHITINILNTIN